MRLVPILVSLLALGGCVLASDGPDGATEPESPGLSPEATGGTTRARLARPRTLAVRGGSSEVTARRLLGDDLVETATLSIEGGALTVHALADGRLGVDELTLRVGDVHLSPLSVPPNGLELTAITVHVRPLVVAARWSTDETAVSAAAPVELLLDWSLASQPGQLLPMATQHIEVPLTVELAPGAGGKLVATLRAARPGVFFTWSGLLELGDLALTVEAADD